MQKMHILMLGISLMLVTTLVTESYAQPQSNAKVRAIQDGNSLSTDPGTEGVLGKDIDCVGGINDPNANDFHCFLVRDPPGLGTIDWAAVVAGTEPMPSNAIKLDTTIIITCPTGVGFQPTDTCFKVTFDASDITVGHQHFIGVFTQNDNVIDVTGNKDFRIHSFFVLPETAIGAVAILASIFGAFIAYSIRR